VSPRTPLAVGDGSPEERDCFARPPGVLVGGIEVVAGAQSIGVGVAQDPLAVGDQALAVFDGLGETVAEVVQAPDRPAAQPQQGFGQRGVLFTEVGREVLVQSHDLLNSVAGGGPVVPRPGQGLGRRFGVAKRPCTSTWARAG
jgi:hypothetical protein